MNLLVINTKCQIDSFQLRLLYQLLLLLDRFVLCDQLFHLLLLMKKLLEINLDLMLMEIAYCCSDNSNNSDDECHIHRTKTHMPAQSMILCTNKSRNDRSTKTNR